MSHYTPSPLEKWICERYTTMNIFYPSELKPKNIADSFDIEFDQYKGHPISSHDSYGSYIVTTQGTYTSKNRKCNFCMN